MGARNETAQDERLTKRNRYKSNFEVLLAIINEISSTVEESKLIDLSEKRHLMLSGSC